MRNETSNKSILVWAFFPTSSHNSLELSLHFISSDTNCFKVPCTVATARISSKLLPVKTYKKIEAIVLQLLFKCVKLYIYLTKHAQKSIRQSITTDAQSLQNPCKRWFSSGDHCRYRQSLGSI